MAWHRPAVERANAGMTLRVKAADAMAIFARAIGSISLVSSIDGMVLQPSAVDETARPPTP